MRRFHLCTLKGVAISIDPTFVVVALFFAWLLATGFALPAPLAALEGGARLLFALAALVGLALSVLAVEVAHAFAAQRAGIAVHSSRSLPAFRLGPHEPGASFMRHLREALSFLKQAFKTWSEGDVPALGASIAFYTLFSIGPLFLIIIAIAGFVFGAEAAQGKVFAELNGLLGASGAKAVQDIVESSNRPRAGTLASIAGIVMFVFAATGAFAQIKAALNVVWQAKKEQQPKGVKGFLKTRVLSFAIVLVIGFLMMVSLIGSSLINIVSERLLADDRLAFLAEAANVALSLVVFTALCAAIFKFLPDVKIPWRDVWLGAAVTTVLFIAGRTGLAAYLGRESTTNVYGAASSLVLVLLWVYYCSQIFLLGAAITFVYAQRHGSRRSDLGRDAHGAAAPVSRSAPIATARPASRLLSLRRRRRGTQPT